MRYNVYSPEQRRYYWTPGQKVERQFVLGLIAQHTQGKKSGNRQFPALSIIEELGHFGVDAGRAPGKLGFLLTLELAAIWIVMRPVPGILPMVFGILIQVLPVFMMCIYWKICREKVLRKEQQLARMGRVELKKICRTLQSALSEFDEQTRRYFASETIYDGYMVYILRQLYVDAKERFETVDVLLRQDSRTAVIYALDGLRNPLRIRCSLTGEMQDRLIPLTSVPPISRGILAYLLRILRRSRVIEASAEMRAS